MMVARAMPKSTSFTVPPQPTTMLPGEMSQCTTLQRRAVVVRLVVRVDEPARRLRQDGDGEVARQEVADLDAATADGEQIAPGDVLHGDEVRPAVVADVEHLDDVRVVERLRDAPLVDEHLHHAGHLDVARLDLLDDEVGAGEARAARQPQVRHAAGREVADELVVAVALACDERLRHRRGPKSVCTTRTDDEASASRS